MRQIPLFPLGLVLYPEQETPLHIFEERYKDMVQHCLSDDVPFGLVLIYDGKITEVGCTARIVQILHEYEDGRRDILVRGEERFRIAEVIQRRSYYLADVHPIVEQPHIVDWALRERVIAQHIKWQEMAQQRFHVSDYGAEHAFLSFALATKIPLKIEQQQRLLQIPTETERLDFLAQFFETNLPELHEMMETRRLVQSDGHFEHIPPTLGVNPDEDE